MAKGVVELKGSDDKTYKLKFGTNAICKIQEALDRPLGAILASLTDETRVDMRILRTMVQCALIEPANATPEQAGDLIDDVGFGAITKAFGQVFAGESGANPPGAQSGEPSASPAPASA